ncbi:MAG TPA: TVP38/TMEM64 family protein [Candidatus Pelethousia gallinarum]|nr:TVP38/TMEM64 family protein [Candidatus Pelethousia gallinarum]
MEQKTNKKKTLTKLYILAVLAILCLVYFLVPSVNAYVNQVASVLGSANVDTVVAFIRSYGAYAMAFSFALMVFQSVIAPLPAFLITFANAAIFGWWQGAILSWTSSMAGAALCFYLARALGRDTVEKYAGKGALASVEGYFEKYGSRTILVCRLLPFVSFDAISYFAGLTPIKFWPFFIATGVGQLPATIIYSYVGGMLTGGVKYFVTALLCIFSLGILVMIVRRIYMERQEKKKQAMEAAQPEAHE